MAKKNISLKKNFIMNIILTMTSFIFPLITFPYVSRILLAEGTGKVSFATSLISYFTLFSQLGVPIYGIRACAIVRDNKEELSRTVQELFIIRLITTLISYAAFAVVLLTVPRLQADRTLYIIVSFNIFFTFIGLEWLYKALERYTYITVRSIAFKFVALVAMFVLIHQKSDYVIYGGITIFAASASNIFNFINLHKHISLKPLGHYNLKRHLKPVLIFFAMSCATTIYTHLDTLMLGFMATDTDVGYYSAAVKIKNILVSLVTSLGAVLLPRVSYYIKNGQMDSFIKMTSKALHFVILIATPMMVYFMLYAGESIRFLSGSGYEGAIVPMIIIMPTLLFIGASNLMGIQILVPLGKERVVLYSEILGAILDLVINALLIPKFTSSGAAVGTVVAEFSVALFQLVVLKDLIIPILKKIDHMSIIGALILASVASVWVKAIPLSSFFALVISAVCFFVVYAVVLKIRNEALFTELEKQVLGWINKRVKG